MLSRRIAIASCSLIVLGLLGCKKAQSIKTVPVTGAVKYKGQPVVGAIVTFLKTADGGKTAGGLTDSAGKFMLSTYIGGVESQEGALEGTYTVTVASTSAGMPETPAIAVDPLQLSADEAKAMREKATFQAGKSQGGGPEFQKKQALERANSSLPAKYAGPDTTPFKNYAVKAGEKNSFELELTDD